MSSLIQDARRNEIGIETGLDAVGEDPIEIAAHGWFAAGQVQLQDAHRRRLAEGSPHSSALSSALARSSSSGLEQ